MWWLYSAQVFCSAGQSALGKQYAFKGGTASNFNLSKILSGLIVFGLWGLVGGFSVHLPTIWLGLLYGLFLFLSMQMGFMALAIGPMALTSIIASFSLIIPLFFGIMVWNETLSLFGQIGIVLITASIVLLNAKKEQGVSVKWLLLALATLLSNGICSVIQNLHQRTFPTLYRTEFMIAALLSASIWLIAVETVRAKRLKRVRFSPSALGVGAGVLNGAANYLVLFLSATENASVLFPIVSVANVIAVWLVGHTLFRERLKAIQIVGLLCGVSAIVLLKL